MAHDHQQPTGAPSPIADVEMDMGSGGSMSKSMQMYFYFGKGMTLLFPSWKTTTPAGLIGAIIVMFVLAIVYEALKAFREYLNHKAVHYLTCSLLYKSEAKLLAKWKEVFLGKGWTVLTIHVVQSLLQVIHVSIAYLLMLAVMTYNGWIFLAIVFGAGVGYLAFGWARYVYGGTELMRDNTDYCH